MKRTTKVAIIILLGVFPFLSMGQSKGFQIGIEGGPAISTLRYDLLYFPSKYIEAGLGGAIGVALKYDINKRFAIKTSISGELKGSSDVHEATNTLVYLTVPLLFQVKFGETPRFFTNFGLYAGYLLPSTQNDYYFHDLDFGCVLGLGVDVPISDKFGLSFEIRNSLGLVNISKNTTYFDNHGDPVTEIGERYTNSTSILVGFTYTFTRK
jgi:hypothetical protein